MLVIVVACDCVGGGVCGFGFGERCGVFVVAIAVGGDCGFEVVDIGERVVAGGGEKDFGYISAVSSLSV